MGQMGPITILAAAILENNLKSKIYSSGTNHFRWIKNTYTLTERSTCYGSKVWKYGVLITPDHREEDTLGPIGMLQITYVFNMKSALLRVLSKKTF